MSAQLEGGLKAWRAAGYEIFQDVNSYAKAFGELVESRRHTPSLPADDVAALIAAGADIAILDVRRFDEYATMNIPGSVSVPGAELVLRAGAGRARPRHHHRRELRRPHPLDHRHPIADQCRRAQQGGGAAQRHHRLDAGQAHARARREQARRDRRVRRRAAKRPRRRLSRRRSPPRCRGFRRAAGAASAHALSLRRPRRRGICSRPPQGFSPLSGRPAGAGNRHGGARARRAHRADRRQEHPRRHDRIMARADGLGSLRARRRL